MTEMNFIKIIYFIPFLISHLMVNAQDLKRVLKTLEKRDIEKAKELLESPKNTFGFMWYKIDNSSSLYGL